MDKKVIDKKTMGRRSRAAGKLFENNVRHDLESRGWIVCKWTNTVDLKSGKLMQAKSKYNPFLKRVMNEGSGLPDYIAYMPTDNYNIIGVEAKKGKYLDAEEKKMIQWLLNNKVFPAIYVAYPDTLKIFCKGKKKTITYMKIENGNTKTETKTDSM
jgi:hypothetical protein